MEEPTVRVRGIHLVHDGRGYHDLEVDLPKKYADFYIATGKAVLVQSEPAEVPPAHERPATVPSVKGR